MNTLAQLENGNRGKFVTTVKGLILFRRKFENEINFGSLIACDW